MIKNYIKIAFRNLWNHRLFSVLNILGLTVGMTACFLIFMYVTFKTSQNDFAYLIKISWSAFALAMVITITVAYLTIMFQTLKTATTNPTKSLRTE